MEREQLIYAIYKCNDDWTCPNNGRCKNPHKCYECAEQLLDEYERKIKYENKGENMNHIVTMSIDVDEETIRNKIVENCAKEIIVTLNNDYLRGGYRYGDKEGLAEVVRSVTEDIIEKNKDFIIDEAIKKIVKKVTDSKAFKDKFKEIE